MIPVTEMGPKIHLSGLRVNQVLTVEPVTTHDSAQ